jgi:phospholipase D3/4
MIVENDNDETLLMAKQSKAELERRRKEFEERRNLKRKQRYLVSWLILTALVLLVCGSTLLAFKLRVSAADEREKERKCENSENYFVLVESMPLGVNLSYPGGFESTRDDYGHSTARAWLSMIENAKSSIDIVCMYMTLNDTDDRAASNSDSDDRNEHERIDFDVWFSNFERRRHEIDDDNGHANVDNGHDVGVQVYDALVRAARDRHVRIRIVESFPSTTAHDPSVDAQRLRAAGLADVRLLNMSTLANGGVVHNKIVMVDDQVFYVGSANIDWRSLTQVKELGVVVRSDCLAADMKRQFSEFWTTAHHDRLPLTDDDDDDGPWPPAYWALFNGTDPARILFDEQQGGERRRRQLPPHSSLSDVEERLVDDDDGYSHVYMTMSPQWFCPTYRMFDLDAIADIMHTARRTLSISVMDYMPTTLYTDPKIYWPPIDDAIRAAAFERDVDVRMLISVWAHTKPAMIQYLYSLEQLAHVTVRLMYIPQQPNSAPVPFTRVNHCKYLVSETQALVSTSNWSGDYFLTTTGTSFVSDDLSFVAQAQAIFDRDWQSPYSYRLDDLPNIPI